MTQQEYRANAFIEGRKQRICPAEIDMEFTDEELSERILQDTGKAPQKDSVYLFLTQGNSDGQVVIFKPNSDGDEMLILECREVPELRKRLGVMIGRDKFLREVFKEA